jgi:hypothetical protein
VKILDPDNIEVWVGIKFIIVHLKHDALCLHMQPITLASPNTDNIPIKGIHFDRAVVLVGREDEAYSLAEWSNGLSEEG